VGLSATGCLVTDVPDFQEPTKTPPIMIDSTASPPLYEIITFVKGPNDRFAEQAFSVRVESEDGGDDLEARFWLSRRSPGKPVDPVNGGGGGTLAASTLSDTSRVLSKGFTPVSDLAQGCYQLFWIVSHDLEDGDTDCPKDPTDAAQVSWTALVCDSDPCADTVLPSCNVVKPEGFAVPCPQSGPAGGGS
jgi:hypothetical protein